MSCEHATTNRPPKHKLTTSRQPAQRCCQFSCVFGGTAKSHVSRLLVSPTFAGNCVADLNIDLSALPVCPRVSMVQRRAQYRFWRVRFQMPSSVSFLALTKFRGESSVSLSELLSAYYLRVRRTLELTEFRAELSELSLSLYLEAVLSKQYSTCFLMVQEEPT